MKIFFIVYFFVIFYLLSKENEIGPVLYLDKNYNWTGPVKILLRDKKIIKINKVISFSNKYLTPSFCDAQVTLGMNSLGSGNDLKGVELALKSLLAHGFTNVLASFEPEWVKKYYLELLKKKKLVPNIIFLQRPILPKTEEYSELPLEIYFSSYKKNDLYKEIEQQANFSAPILLIHRYYPENKLSWKSIDFYKIFTKFENKKITVASFADKNSILDVLLAGGKYLEHPIPISLEKSIKKEHLQDLHWLPLLNVYWKMDLLHKQEIEEYKSKLSTQSIFFKKNYLPLVGDYSFSFENSNYKDYIEFYKKYQEFISKIILASGAGNLFSFPGISGLEELQILYLPTQKENEYLKFAIQNSCEYLGILEKRNIEEGKEIDMILFKKNPSNPENLFSIEKVFYGGKIISLED